MDHIIQHRECMIWADMGLGKSISTLTAIQWLRENLEISAVLVVAPLRIVQTVWRQEAEKWEHTRGLRFSLIHGTRQQRTTALWRKADIYLVNYENLPWLVTEIGHRYLRHRRYPPFNMVVYDEITKVKNPSSQRSKAWAQLLPCFSRRVGLTGEPAANGYRDLHGQFLVVDQGQRLGVSQRSFRERFLRPTGYGGRDWTVTRTGQEQIHARIQDITLELSAADHLDLPELRTNVIWVDLPEGARTLYEDLEKKFFAELESGAELSVNDEGSKLNKLLQIASGAVYYEAGAWEEIHRAKLEALQDALEESGGRPMLLGYTYRHEAARIAQTFPEQPSARFGASLLSSKLSEKGVADVIRRWERDEIPLLCGHPASMGHGLNLQGSSARAVIWFSLPWSLELYNQLNGRLFGGYRRQGSSVIHHILARDTMDEVVYDALARKDGTQAALRAAIKRYQERRT